MLYSIFRVLPSFILDQPPFFGKSAEDLQALGEVRFLVWHQLSPTLFSSSGLTNLRRWKKTILIKLGKKGEATRYDLSREKGGLNYSTVWKAIRELKGKKAPSGNQEREKQEAPLKNRSIA